MTEGEEENERVIANREEKKKKRREKKKGKECTLRRPHQAGLSLFHNANKDSSHLFI